MSTQTHKLINQILTPDDLIIDGNQFAGNIEVNSLINNTGPLKSYNLMQTNGSLADVFKSLSVPIGLLHFGNMFDKHTTFDSSSDSDISNGSDSSSDSDGSSDSDDEKKHKSNAKRNKSQKGGLQHSKKFKKHIVKMNHHPNASVVPDDLFDKFLDLAQDLRAHKKQRTTRKTHVTPRTRTTKKHNA